jgi:hypothetical protein
MRWPPAWPLPSREGVGDGWGSSAAEAVSQFPGPPLEDPPTSPPRESTGAQLGGARWDDWRTRCPAFGRRSVAADVPACLARRSSRADHFKAFSGPASGMAGDRGDDLAGVQRTKRSGVSGTPVSSSSWPRSRTREGNKARDPRARERAAVVMPAGIAGLTSLFGIAMKEQP